MTGEITLRGRILPVGGLKEKLLAAKRAGLKKVIIPEKNRKDLDEIPKNILKGLKLEFMENIDDAVKHTMEKYPLKTDEIKINEIDNKGAKISEEELTIQKPPEFNSTSTVQ